MLPVVAVNVLVVWSLLAAGGVYTWGAVPVIVIAVVLAAWVRPPLGDPAASRRVDVALAVFLAAASIQLVPWPRGALDVLSPAVTTFQAAYRVDAGVAPLGPSPLSIAPAATTYTLALAAACVLLFWTARGVFAHGGLRLTVRTISALGLAVSVLAVVQRSVAPGLIYGLWEPRHAGAAPIGPVVNANQFGAWLLLALPLAVGYLAAHLETRRHRRRARTWQSRLRRLASARVMFLAASATLMGTVIVFSRSRSAMAGLAAGAAFGWLVARGRAGGGARRLFVPMAVLLVAAVAAWVNLDVLWDRFNRLDSGMAGRVTIWRDTLSVAGRFSLTGVGLGAYETAMAVFQTTTREVLYNHAHSQYLQMAAEGGLLLSVPALAVLGALVAGGRAALAADRSPTWSIRVGAASGLVAVAVQSAWESVLRMPANGVLLAVVAAILLHRPSSDPPA